MSTYATTATVWTPPSKWVDDGIFLNIAVMEGTPGTQTNGNPNPQPTRSSPPMFVQVDTGSQGVVVNVGYLYSGDYTVTRDKDNVPTSITQDNLRAGVSYIGPGKIVYTSKSGSVHQGFYFKVACLGVGVDPANGGAAAYVQNAVILGVVPDKVVSGEPTPNVSYDNNKPEKDQILPGPLMMGIGFGRPNMGTNLFVNAVDQAGTSLYPSYRIGSSGIVLGEQDPAGFSYQQLGTNSNNNGGQYTENTGNNPGKLDTPLGQVIFTPKGGTPPENPPKFNVLIDTGLDEMILNSSYTLGAGSVHVSIYSGAIGSTSETALNYHFDITSNEEPYVTNISSYPMAPSYVKGSDKETSESSGNRFVNTGFHPLRGYEIYLDYPNAKVGYLKASS